MGKDKKSVENEIISKVRKIFCPSNTEDFLIKLKEEDLKEEKNKKENKNSKSVEDIVNENFSENFLIPIPKKEEKIVVLGINPRWRKWK